MSLVAGRQLVVSTGDLDSASQQKVAAEMSLRSLQRCPRSSILYPFVPFCFDGLPLATEGYSGREKCL